MLPDAWVEKLFQKFEDFYGAKWAAQYGDFPRERVKRTWAEELGGFADKGECLSHAIKAQKSSPFPPTLPEFLRACQDAARRLGTVQPALPAPVMSAEEAARKIDALQQAQPRPSPYDFHHWAKELRAAYLRGEPLGSNQIALASAALGEVWRNKTCTPDPRPAP